MRHIEVSKKIITSHTVDAAAVKYSLVQKLRNIFHIETVGEGMESFTITATSKLTSYLFQINVVLKCDSSRARIIIEGKNNIGMPARIFYILSLLLVLALGLFPQVLAPPYGLAIDAAFFMIVGGFILYDFNRKLDEPQGLIERVLDALEVEFG